MNQQVAALNKAGFRYFDFGVAKNREGRKTADFYKGDKLTPEMRDSLEKDWPGWVTFGTGSKEYAPELVKPIVFFLRERNPVLA